MSKEGYFSLPCHGQSITKYGLKEVMITMTWSDLNDVAAEIEKLRNPDGKKSVVKVDAAHLLAWAETP